MRNTMIAIALIAWTMLAGCQSDQIKPFLDNLHTDCKRDYTFSLASGGVGGVGASGTVTGNVHCEPSGAAATATPPASPPSQ